MTKIEERGDTPTPTDTAPGAVDEAHMEMHPSIAEAWAVWAPLVGKLATSTLEHVQETFPQLRSAVLSTADGLHICSLGLETDDAGRLAALNSSLFGIARAETDIMSHADLAEDATDDSSLLARTSVAISDGDTHSAVLSVVLPPFGHLLLAMSASGVQWGTLMVQTRSAALEISRVLGQSAPSL